MKQKILNVFFLSMIFIGCGGGGNNDSNSQTTISSQTKPETTLQQASDSNIPIKLLTYPFNDDCTQEQVFTLLGSKRTVKAMVFDVNSFTELNSTSVSLEKENFSKNLIYNTQTKKYELNCIDLVYTNRADIYPRYNVVLNEGNITIKKTISLFDNKATNNCMSCHASNSGFNLALPSTPANLNDAEMDFKTNILRLHDERHPTAVKDNLLALQKKGKNYNEAGLEATSKTMIVSCVDCHGSNAISNSGLKNVPSLTKALHSVHTNVNDVKQFGIKCLTCHGGDTIPKMFNGKVMHPLDASWKDEDGHGEFVENNGPVSCTLCHGVDLKGSNLSNGVSCYKCHGNEWGSFSITPTNITWVKEDD
ncbi:hypothetical protein [Caminibacter mediatlanticus]|uniref:Cytochrome c-552/4 domain-containing protein n=1 Tax=Caminibacter mediatlanticus TB-2 TaxID=391592 RepID=A0AAI9F2I0_9BACT|nr:hypothetical protein [Caminibacter mediatlanticus]EDM23780.1 hypothetical protein CMTB2_00894 [Caminibacter mediatlanticus TB-2]